MASMHVLAFADINAKASADQLGRPLYVKAVFTHNIGLTQLFIVYRWRANTVLPCASDEGVLRSSSIHLSPIVLCCRFRHIFKPFAAGDSP